jgi:5-methylcytosine-specific restriction endonuclease McrA
MTLRAAPKPTPRQKEPKRLESRPRPVIAKAARETFERDQHLCQWCKRPGGRLVPHHRFRRSAGGRDIPEHMVSVHQLCHSYIHDHPREAQERGFLVRSADALRHDWT